MTPGAHIADLEGIIAQQQHQLDLVLAQSAARRARVEDLEAWLARDSHTSSKPPSSDGLARKTKSLRRRNGKKPGEQIGHRGAILRLVAIPDAVVEHRPAKCVSCQSPLPEEAPVVLHERLVCMPQVYRRVMTVIYSPMGGSRLWTMRRTTPGGMRGRDWRRAARLK